MDVLKASTIRRLDMLSQLVGDDLGGDFALDQQAPAFPVVHPGIGESALLGGVLRELRVARKALLHDL
jgi:hypothetical protein